MDSPVQWVPKVVDGTEITKLPIDPMEGFILSRIDGRVTVADIADLTGFESVQVVATIEKLVMLGAAAWAVGGPPPSRPRRSSARPVRHEEVDDGASSHRSAAPPPVGIRGGLYDPQELEEAVDLPMERRRQVLDTFYRLDDLSHYELLGIAEDAEKKDVRHAYFMLSKIFHPDTLFGKQLGTYKAKMEKVFRHLTEAYEVLGKKKKRAEYDEYLAIRKLTLAAQRTVEEGQQVALEIERERESQLPPAPPEELLAAEPVAPPPAEEVRAPSPPPPTPEEAAARRRRAQEFAARRLASSLRPGASSRPSASPAASTSPVPPPPAGGAVDRDRILRGLTSSLRGAAEHTGGVDQAHRQLRLGQEHEKAGRLADAASAMRLAVALSPDDPAVEAEYRRVEQRLAASMADTYEKQAQYEERNQKWTSAAISWMRVAEGRPDDPEPRRHAARCLLDGQGDLRRAKGLAQSVVDALPADTEARILLARIFKAAGMTANARREAEAASKLDPANDFVKNLLLELK